MLAFDLDPGPPATIVECAEVALPAARGVRPLRARGVPEDVGLEGDAALRAAQHAGRRTTRRSRSRRASRRCSSAATRSSSCREMRKDAARGQGVHRLEPERRAQDDGQRVLAARARAPDGLDAGHVGRGRGRAAVRAIPTTSRSRPTRCSTRVAEHGDLFAPVLELQQELPGMRRLLLTGAAGRIAAAVRPVVRELAEELVLTDRVEPGGLEPGERFERADLADPEPWQGLAGGLRRGAASRRRARRGRRSTCSPVPTCTARSTSTRRRGAPACGASSSPAPAA